MERQVMNIEELEQRQQAFDQAADDALSHAKTNHPNMDLDDIFPTCPDGESHNNSCEECNCPSIQVMKRSTNSRVWCCRDCVNALKLVSIKHGKFPDEVCYQCRVKYDDYGIIRGVVHISLSRDPGEVDDGTDTGGKVTVGGLIQRIAAGEVFIDDDTGEVSIRP